VSRILVAGAGSIGTVLGVLLKQEGHEVYLLRRVEQNKSLEITVVGELQTNEELPIVSLESDMDPEIVFITVQEQQTLQLCQDLQTLDFATDTLLVSLQNGLNAAKQILANLSDYPLIVGTIWWSATLADPQTVLYHRKADTVLGIPSGSKASELDLEELFQLLSPVLQVSTTDDILKEMRTKLILNVVSPILALVKQPYPEGLQTNTTRRIVHALFDEALETASLLDWQVSNDTRLEEMHLNLISGKFAGTDQEREIQHKVSTQLGIEKYGGIHSNVHELLDWLHLSGSLLAAEIIDLVEQQSTEYTPLPDTIFETILDKTSYASCKYTRES